MTARDWQAEYEAHLRKLAADHAALADDLAALRESVTPRAPSTALVFLGEDGGARLRSAAVSGMMGGAAALGRVSHAVVTAGAALARRHPKAAATLGGGAVVWMWLRGKGRAGQADDPDWLAQALSLRADVADVQAKLTQAEAKGALLPEEAQLQRRAVDLAWEEGLTRLMGEGLDALEADTRAAAFEARRDLYERRDVVRHHGLRTLLCLGGVAGVALTLWRSTARNGNGDRA